MKHLGLFQLGMDDVDVWAHPGIQGASFWLAPGPPGNRPKMEIGLDSERFSRVFGWALHEAFEMVCVRLRLRYEHTQKFSESHADFLFVFTHEQMAEVLEQAAYFLTLVHGKLHTAWKAARAPARRPTKKHRRAKVKRPAKKKS